MRKKKRILLTGGGSGGHIIPNLAVVTAFKKRADDFQFLYIGSRNPIDAHLVRGSGISFKPIFAGKLRRYFSFRNLLAPFLVLMGFVQSFFILIRFWPDVIFAKGGFVSVPVVLSAWILRRPVILHESDSRMGLANRVNSFFANKICVSFPGLMEDSPKTVFTGNPVRTELLHGNQEEGYRLTGFRSGRPIVLIWGGSQGAQQINNLIAESFSQLKTKFQVIHITGKSKGTAIFDPAYVQFEYLAADQLKHIYAITDLVVGRAGANSLYELALVQKPNVIIPLLNSDQLSNAAYFQQKGASIIFNQNDSLSEILLTLWHNESKRTMMQEALSSIARPEAAEEIANLIFNL